MKELLKLGADQLEYYDQRQVMAASGLHSQVFSLVKNTISNGLILDIAAGEGSFSKRLQDSGYEVDSVDLNGNIGQDFIRIDLNNYIQWANFVSKKLNHYDLVVSIETVEHLENPWMFFRGLRDVVKPGGYIILTHPNIENPVSKILFLIKNRFLLFGDLDIVKIDPFPHINPIPCFEISLICSRLGLSIESINAGGSYPLIKIDSSHILKSICWSTINILSIPITSDINRSMCKIYKILKH